jgi:hypothetical protein
MTTETALSAEQRERLIDVLIDHYPGHWHSPEQRQLFRKYLADESLEGWDDTRLEMRAVEAAFLLGQGYATPHAAYHDVPREQDGPIRIALEMRSAAHHDRTKDACTRSALAGWADRLSDWFSREVGQCHSTSGWRDISTAPKDEAVDVLLHGPLGTGVGYWEPPVEQEDEDGRPAGPIPAGWWGERGYWPAGSEAQPTHWMPLPAAPSSTAAAIQGSRPSNEDRDE